MFRSVLKIWLLLGLTAGSADVAFRWPDVMATSLADIVLGCLMFSACAAVFRRLRTYRQSPEDVQRAAYRPPDRRLPR